MLQFVMADAELRDYAITGGIRFHSHEYVYVHV